MMMCARVLSVAVLVLVASPAGATGQAIDRVAVFGAVGVGDSVRLDASRIGRLEGRFVLATATLLTLTSTDSVAQVPLPDIERLWVRGRATRRGAVIGGGVGAVVGIVGGLLISRIACEPVDGGDCTAAEVAATLGLVGGAGGAALGAGIGFSIPRWHLRIP